MIVKIILAGGQKGVKKRLVRVERGLDVFYSTFYLLERTAHTVSAIIVSVLMGPVQSIWIKNYCIPGLYDFINLTSIETCIFILQIVYFHMVRVAVA